MCGKYISGVDREASTFRKRMNILSKREIKLYDLKVNDQNKKIWGKSYQKKHGINLYQCGDTK